MENWWTSSVVLWEHVAGYKWPWLSCLLLRWIPSKFNKQFSAKTPCSTLTKIMNPAICILILTYDFLSGQLIPDKTHTIFTQLFVLFNALKCVHVTIFVKLLWIKKTNPTYRWFLCTHLRNKTSWDSRSWSAPPLRSDIFYPLNLLQPAGASRPCVFLLHDYMGGAHFTTPSLWQQRLRAAQVSLAITSPHNPNTPILPSPAWEHRDLLWLGGERRSPPLSLFYPQPSILWAVLSPLQLDFVFIYWAVAKYQENLASHLTKSSGQWMMFPWVLP